MTPFRGRKRVEVRDDANPLEDATWLYSFADLMTQLLIFSILMLTALGLRELEQEKEKEKPQTEAMSKLQADVEKLAKEANLGDALVVDRAADQLTIRMKSAILFREAQDRLTPDAERVLAELAPILTRTPNKLRVEGHTDDVAINSALFPSNWELSSARAISVTRYLEALGVPPDRLSVAGYGEFHPMVPNDSAHNRALNRRVEIVVLGG